MKNRKLWSALTVVAVFILGIAGTWHFVVSSIGDTLNPPVEHTIRHLSKYDFGATAFEQVSSRQFLVRLKEEPEIFKQYMADLGPLVSYDGIDVLRYKKTNQYTRAALTAYATYEYGRVAFDIVIVRPSEDALAQWLITDLYVKKL